MSSLRREAEGGVEKNVKAINLDEITLKSGNHKSIEEGRRIVKNVLEKLEEIEKKIIDAHWLDADTEKHWLITTLREQLVENQMRKFPVMKFGHIPMWLAEKAHSQYVYRFGNDQSLERLGERGGFGIEEMDEFVPGWRDELNENIQLKKQVEALQVINQRCKDLLEHAIHNGYLGEGSTKGWAEEVLSDLAGIEKEQE